MEEWIEELQLHVHHTSLATVAVSHINRQKQSPRIWFQIESVTEKVSEYVQALSRESWAKYVSILLSTELSIVRYVISYEYWQDELDAVLRMQ